MKARPILTRSISSLLVAGSVMAAAQTAKGADVVWDGGGIGGTDLGTAVNWLGDVLPSVAAGDTAVWDGTVAGPLSLIYSNGAFLGAAGNPGINLSLTATQTSSLSIDTGANTNALRMNNIMIAAGAGAFTLGDGAGTFTLNLGGAAGQTHTWTNDSTNAATIAADVGFNMGGGGAHTLVLAGSGNWNVNNLISQAGGTLLSLVKNGAGTLTLGGTGVSTYTGGLVLNGGTLNINKASALGNTAVGALTINGGTLDNTSGALVTTTTAKAVNINADFTFTGSNNLNFNTGAATVAGLGNQRTINVGGGATKVLTFGSLLASSHGLTKDGTGVLAMAGTAASRVVGDLVVNAGVFQIGAQDFVAGGSLSGAGTIENGSATGRWLYVHGSANSTFSGTLQNGAGAGTLGLWKGGTGTLTLTGPATYTNQTSLAGGTLEFGSSTTTGTSRTLSTAAGAGLQFERGDSAVKSSSDGTGTASLTFGIELTRAAGGTGNFVIAGGTNGVTNSINLTAAAGFLNQAYFFNGDNYAWMNTANGYVRGLAYGSDPGAVTSGTTASLVSATHQEFTGDITGQGTETFTTLKNSGNNAFTLAAGATVTTNGFLKTGNIAGGAIISGGTGIQAASGAELVIRVNEPNDTLTFNTPILANGASSLTTSGAGTLNLGAANTYTGITTINGTVNLTGSIPTGVVDIAGGGVLNVPTGGGINPTNIANSGRINIGASTGGNAILNINGGTVNATQSASPSLNIGGRGTVNQNNTNHTWASNSSGFLKMTAGTLTIASELHIGNGNTTTGNHAYGAMNVSGGTVSAGNWIVVGAQNDRAVLNQSGGTITVAANRMTIGAGGNASLGLVNLSGGTFTDNAGIFVGENGTGILNVSGTAEMSLGPLGTLQFAGNAASVAGTVNLLGGSISANAVTKGTGTGVYFFNFDGGTLKPTASNATFFADLANTEAFVYDGNAIFDTSNLDITVGEPLRAPTGNGISAIAVASGGAGYVDTPLVIISGGSGRGAQAVANVTGGVVTSFTITNPGTGYSPSDVLNVNVFGGGATTQATAGAVTIAQNVSGGVVKNGGGTLTLNGASNYRGNVAVNQGTLVAGTGFVGNPVTGSLGDNTVPGRTITVAPGATLRLGTNDVFGNQTAVVANLPTLNVNGGTLSTVTYNQLGTLNLNAGTLLNANTMASGAYQSYQFLADVNVIGAAPSSISTTAAPNFDGVHLSALTNFNVADVTGNASTDLLVSAPFRDQSGNFATAAGGLQKTGPGKMELTAASTYTGPTTVTAGTLQLSGTAEINGSSGVEINGAGAKLVQASSVAMTPIVTLNNGTIDGTGTLNIVAVADLATNTIVNGNGTAGVPLTIGGLVFNGAAKISLLMNGLTPGLMTMTLTANGAPGSVTIDASNTAWNNGTTYDLVTYGGGSILGTGFPAFVRGAITGLGARQSATLGNSGTAITLSIAGDLPAWTGLGDGQWTTAVQAPKNWRLLTGGTPTDFLTNDAVLFDDSATGTAVNIIENVMPVSTTFDNPTKTYNISSPGGFGIASGTLTKNGAGILNLGGTHTYTGATALNAGTTNLSGSFGNTAVTVAGPATLNVTAASAISQNTVTVNGTFTQTVSNALSGTAAIVFNNGATLGTSNNHSGGTTLGSGNFNLATATAIGTGTLTIGSITLDNTSGGPLTLTNNNAQVWSNDGALNFTGTNALDLGTGAVTLGSNVAAGAFTLTNNSALPGTSLTVAGPVTGAAGGVRTLNVFGTGGTVFSGNITRGTAGGLVINDNVPGMLTLSGAASSITTLNLNGGASSIVELGAGNLTLANGGGNILQSTTGSTINATGGGSIVLGSAGGDFGTAGGTTLTVNARLTGTNQVDFFNANGGLGLGTINLTAANTNTGGMNVENTRVVIPTGGAYNFANTANAGQVSVGTVGGANAVLDLNGGTINATKTASPSISLGTVANATGVVNMSSGTINSTSEIWVANAAGSYGAFTMTAGMVNVGSWLPVGRGGSGYMNMSGGTINVTGQNVTVGSFGAANGTLPTAFGVVNLTGNAVLNITNATGTQGRLIVAEAGAGHVTVSGNAAVNVFGPGGVNFSSGNAVPGTNTGNGILNLNGGVVTTPIVQKGTGTGTGTLNFDGGTLKARAASATFMQGLTGAFIHDGGATIDDSGFAITVAQPLVAPTGNGVGSINVSGGSGYVAAPLVSITGDGTGATAIASIDASGNLTGITITNPGVGYTFASATLVGGGGFGANVDAVNLAANTSGSFTKLGTGTLTLTGANTFTGAVNVNAGTLYANPGNAANNRAFSFASGITVASGATLRSSANGLFGFDGTQEKPITVNAGGTLTADGGAGSQDVAVGTVTLAGGTLASLAGSTDFGTWRFDNATDKLIVTEDSTASATNVKFQNGGSIDVAATRTLNFTGTITDTTLGGISSLVKSGAGTVILAGDSNYTGATTIQAGTLQVGNGNAATLAGGNYAGAISNSGTLIFNSTATQSLNGGISGAGPLLKDGSGALTIGGTNTLGAVTVTAGTLTAAGPTTAGATSVANSATLGARVTSAGSSVLTLGANPLTFGASGYAVDFNSLNPTAPIVSMPTGLLTLNGTVTPSFSNTSALNNGVYTLIDYGTLAGAGSFSGTSITFGPRSSGMVSNDAGNTAIILTINADSPVWTGLNGSAWTELAPATPVTGTPNFALKNAKTATDFWTGDSVEFNDTYDLGGGPLAVANTTVSITPGAVNANGVAPGAVTFNNSVVNYTVGGGSITAGTVVKNGAGTVTITSSNSYTGGTTINAGRIAINSATGLGGTSGALTLNNGTLQTTTDIVTARNIVLGHANSTILVDPGTTYTVNTGLVSGSGALNKSGTGTLILGSANTYTGGTTINAGTLQLTTLAGVANSGVFNLAGGTFQLNVATNNFGYNPTINVTADSTFSNVGAGLINHTGTITGSSTQLTVSTGGARLYLNGPTTGITQVNVAAGAMGLDLNTPNHVGNAPVVVASGASFWFAGGGANPISNNITFNGGTGLNGVGALFYEGGVPNPAALAGTITLSSGDTSFGAAFAADTVTISGPIVGGGALTKISGNAYVLTGTNTYTGTTTIAAGTLQLGNGGTTGSLSPSSVITDNGTLVLNRSNTVTQGTDFGAITGTGALIVRGGGTVVLNTPNSRTGATTIENGRLRVATGGAINEASVANSGQLTVGAVTTTPAVLELAGGTINATKNTVPSGIVGNVSGAVAAMNVTAGTLNSTSEFWVGSAAGAYGALTQSGGTLNIGSWLPVGRNGSGYVNMSGGTINVTGNNLTTGSFTGANGTLPSSFGVVNLTGNAMVNITNTAANQGRFVVAEAGLGQLNVSGNAALNIAGVGGLNFASGGTPTAAGTGTGIANLNGGTVTTTAVSKGTGSGTGTLNFDGGILKAGAANATFMQGLTAAYVNDGGAIIDDGGFAITIGQPLLAPTGSGVSSIGFIPGGGYTGAPLVQITGDGSGATAIANIDASGNLTGIAVTNPGVNYTFATATLIGGGGTALADAVAFAANTSGGLTKLGAGTVTLGGASNYTGDTTVEAGTLLVSGSLSGTTNVDVNNGGTLGGNGSITTGNDGSIALSTGAKLAPGISAGTLTLALGAGTLDISTAVLPNPSFALAFELGPPAASDKVTFLSGFLTIGTGVLAFNDFAFTNLGGIEQTTYTLFDGVSPISGTLDATAANLMGSIGGGFFGTLGIADSGNDLVLVVIPEPNAIVSLLGGLGTLLGLRRFRRRA